MTFKEEAQKILDGVYARAADNNGNSEYLREGAPDYEVEEALSALETAHTKELAELKTWYGDMFQQLIKQIGYEDARKTKDAIEANTNVNGEG